MAPENVSLLSSLIGSLVLQTAAAKFMFVAPNGVPPKMRFIAECFVWCGGLQAAALSRASLTEIEAAVGLLLYAGALAVFCWTCLANYRRPLSVAYSEDTPGHLVTWGPYRYVRHPFYASYCLTWFAAAAATLNPAAIAAFLLMTVLYVRAARFEERKFLRSAHAAAYAAYRERTGMLLPRVLRQSQRHSGMRWYIWQSWRAPDERGPGDWRYRPTGAGGDSETDRALCADTSSRPHA